MAAPRPSRPRRPPFLPPSPSPSRRPRRPPRCRTAYPASGADGLPGCRCRRPAGRCGTALRYAATAGNDRLGSAGLGAGRGLEQAWLRHRTAMGGACGRRSARAHCRRAEGRGAAEVRGGCGGGRWAGGEAGRGAARAAGVRRPASGGGCVGTAVSVAAGAGGRRSLGLPGGPGCGLVQMAPCADAACADPRGPGRRETRRLLWRLHAAAVSSGTLSSFRDPLGTVLPGLGYEWMHGGLEAGFLCPDVQRGPSGAACCGDSGSVCAAWALLLSPLNPPLEQFLLKRATSIHLFVDS